MEQKSKQKNWVKILLELNGLEKAKKPSPDKTNEESNST